MTVDGISDNPRLKRVIWSEADNCFVGSAPPLIGPCCHGSNVEEVYRELCQMVAEWIAIFRKDGCGGQTDLPPAEDC
jgi:predicted RNase H-like HicB family nuclease